MSSAGAAFLRLVTYNIDGLSEAGRLGRAEAVCRLILELNPQPDVVLLQEVVADNRSIIQQRLAAAYTYHDDNLSRKYSYHCATLLRRTSATLIEERATDYPQSGMGRHLLAVHADVRGKPIALLNSHLESTNEGSAGLLRVNQLRRALTALVGSHTAFSVFAGDLNLRDAEARQVLPDFPAVGDAWESLGKPAALRSTWDTSVNHNLGIAAQIKCRFDRVYYTSPQNTSGGRQGPRAMSLLGTSIVPALQLHPSDHWGLVVDFEI